MKRGIVILLLLTAGLMAGCLGGTLGTAVDLPVKPTDAEIRAQTTNDWTREGLQGKVKMTETQIIIEGEKLATIEVQEFDESGFLRSLASGFTKDKPRQKWVYDERGRLIRQNSYGEWGEYQYQEDWVTVWQDQKEVGRGKSDKFGNIVELKSENPKFQVRAGEKQYVGNRLLAKLGGKDGKTIYEYNEKGQIIQRVIKSKVTGDKRAVYRYDEKGNLLKVVEDGKPYYWYEYVDFDGQGNWTKRYFINKDGKQREERREITYWE